MSASLAGLENIRHRNSIRWVMKNGRLYDGATLDQLWPRQRTAGPFYWSDEEDPPPPAGRAMT